jgi:hypothetical protein
MYLKFKYYLAISIHCLLIYKNGIIKKISSVKTSHILLNLGSNKNNKITKGIKDARNIKKD